MATAQFRLRGRPAHTAGPTYLSYTPDGSKLITVGSNNTARVYKTGYDGEPTNIDDCQEQNTSVAAANKYFVAGSEDGMVSLFSLESMSFDKFLIRSTLPIRDVALSSDGRWCAVASEELAVKIVDTSDNTVIRYLRDQPKPVKHVSFDPSGSHIALSCTDGQIYFYSLKKEEPELIRTVDGLIRTLEADSEVSSRIAWHPDGRAFAAPTPTRDVQVMSKGDWAHQRNFLAGHIGDITDLAWSPNGALLASAGKDKIILWETKTQKILRKYDHTNVMAIAWHPTENILSWTNSDGEVYIHNDFVPETHLQLLRLGRQPAPFIHDPLGEISANVQRQTVNGHKDLTVRQGRQRTPDTVDGILDGEVFSEDDDFVVDDDGAGYSAGLNGNGKRPGNNLDPLDAQAYKRRQYGAQPQYHEPFQPGATPWRGNRRYLCLNLIGFVWTVDQDTHHTVTVEFYDHEFHRDLHFTDTFRYDKACLNEQGALFSSAPQDGSSAVIFYRPHEMWTNRVDWRTELPAGELVTAISLSDSYITVLTSEYVRVYTLFGTPYRIYRHKSFPAVSCASWRDYVMTLGNGPADADGRASLLYTIENIKRDEVCQSQDIVALPPGASISTVFFSDNGDPCIYDSTGVLLVLQHWRTPSQARWVPLLDTKRLSRLASGRKNETYWPVAVADDKFHCIILKGQDKYPYFPRPLLSEFDFDIPVASRPQRKSKSKKPRDDDSAGDHSDSESDADDDEEDSTAKETRTLEEALVRNLVHHSLLQDLVESTRASRSQMQALDSRLTEINKTLIQLLGIECRTGEDRGMKALELVEMLRGDNSGLMINAATKIAERYGRGVLADKIRELGEQRLNGMDED